MFRAGLFEEPFELEMSRPSSKWRIFTGDELGRWPSNDDTDQSMDPDLNPFPFSDKFHSIVLSYWIFSHNIVSCILMLKKIWHRILRKLKEILRNFEFEILNVFNNCCGNHSWQLYLNLFGLVVDLTTLEYWPCSTTKFTLQYRPKWWVVDVGCVIIYDSLHQLTM